jgi:hypothetical protein
VTQDLELGGGQADPAGTALDAPPLEVDEQVPVADHPTTGRIGQVAVRASQERLDPAHQLAQPERLGQVVVRSELEADDLVHLVVARGQDQDGHLRSARAEATQDLEAVDPRQADVEHDQVGRLVRGDVQALLAGSGDGDLIAFLLERVLNAAGNRVLVLDDQDGGGHAGMLHRRPRAHRCGRRPRSVVVASPRGKVRVLPGASPFRPRRRAAARHQHELQTRGSPSCPPPARRLRPNTAT